MSKEINEKIQKAYEDMVLTEQKFECECGSTMKSDWKDKAKCKECGAEMKVVGH